MGKIQQEVDKVDFKGITKRVKSSGIEKEVKKVVQKIKDEFDPNDTSNINIFDFHGLKDNIRGVSTEIQKLKGNSNILDNATKLNVYKQKLQEIEQQAQKTDDAVSKIGFKKYDSNAISSFIDNYKAGNTIKPQNASMNVDTNNLQQQTNQIVTWKEILKDAAKGIAEAFKSVGKQVFNAKNAVGAIANTTSGVANRVVGVASEFKKVNIESKNIKRQLKYGLGHIMKYAGALLSIRGMYSALNSAAHAWLGSQNKEAKQLSANLDYMKYAVGSALAPIIEGIVNLIYQALKGIQSMIYALTGVNIFAKASSKSYASMAKNAKKTKEETKQLVGVHSEINNIQDSKSSDSGTATPSFDLSQIDTASNLIDKIKNADWFSIGQDIGKKINEALDKIPWEQIKSKASSAGKNIAEFINGAVAGTDWKKVGSTLGEGVNTVFAFLKSFLENTDFSSIGGAVGTTINSFFDTVNWDDVGKTLSDGIKGALDFMIGFIETYDPGKVENAVSKIFENIDWSNITNKIMELIGYAFTKINPVFSLIKAVAKIVEGIQNSIPYFQEKIEECGGNVVAGIFKGIGDALVNIGQWIVDNIFNPFIEGFKKAFKINSPSKVMEEQGKFIIQGLLNGIKSLLGNISTIWETIKSTAIEKFENIRNGIAEKWENIKTATSEKWENIKGKVSETAENIKNGVQEKFGQAKEKASEIWNNAKSTIGSKWDEMKTKASNISETIKGTISNKFNDAKSKASSAFEGMKNNLSTSLNNMKNNAGTLGNNVVSGLKNSLGNLGEKAKTWGSDMIQGFTNGINKAKSSISNAVKSVGNTIKNFLHFSRPDMGPLRDYETWMPDMIQGLTRTLNSKAPELYNATHLLAERISDNFNIPILSGVNIPTMNKLISQPDLVSTAPKIQNTNLSNYFYEGQSDEGRPIRIVLNYFGKEVFDETIDYINDKTRRTGKDTIITIDR